MIGRPPKPNGTAKDRILRVSQEDIIHLVDAIEKIEPHLIDPHDIKEYAELKDRIESKTTLTYQFKLHKQR